MTDTHATSDAKDGARNGLLSFDREMELATAWLENKDYKAREELLLAYRPLINGIAAETAKPFGARQHLKDLIQEGGLAMMEILDKFEPARGLRFGTFARHHVQSQIWRYLMDMNGICRIGTNLTDKKIFWNYRKKRTEYEASTGRQLDNAGKQWIADQLGVPLEAVLRMEPRIIGGDLSFDAPRNAGDEDSPSISGTIAAEDPDPEAAAITERHGEHMRDVLNNLVNSLEPRERMVIEHHIMNQNRQSLSQLGRRLGVTKKYVADIETRALRKLRDLMARNNLAIENFRDYF